MKKFIFVFILLFSFNVIVPSVYHYIYMDSSTADKNEGSGFTEYSSPFSDMPHSNSEIVLTDSSENSYVLYNLETQELEEMDVISFLVGCAACEMPVSYEMQAIKAQMIACHSYYLYCKQNGLPGDDLNLSFDERYMSRYASKERLQEYWGVAFDENYQKFLNCANDVKNLVVKYNGEVALTPYYAVSCGRTQTSEAEWGTALEYLTIVESGDDALSDDYLKVKTFSVQEVYDRLMTSFTGFELDLEHPERWFGDIVYNESGYVTEVAVDKVKISGRNMRSCFELNSACFMIFYDDGEFSIATKGYGHGVGLSQFGANQLSMSGKNYEEILMHYFPNTVIEPL